MKYLELKKRDDLNPVNNMKLFAIDQVQDDWEFLSTVLKVQPHLLNLKWLSMLKTNLKIAPWSEEEDQLLNEIIEYFGTTIKVFFFKKRGTKSK
jgi:hypothetical protein